MRSNLIRVIVAVLAVAPAAAQVGTSGGGREEFTAAALSTGGPRTSPVAASVDIVIDRWSTPAERERVTAALKRGQRALLETLQDSRSVGSIRTPGNLAWDLRYAHQEPADEGGRRLFLMTDRPIGIAEAINQPDTIEYPFTLIELRLDRNGEGEGKLSRAARVIVSGNGRFVQIENYEHQPVALTQVRRRD